MEYTVCLWLLRIWPRTEAASSVHEAVARSWMLNHSISSCLHFLRQLRFNYSYKSLNLVFRIPASGGLCRVWSHLTSVLLLIMTQKQTVPSAFRLLLQKQNQPKHEFIISRRKEAKLIIVWAPEFHVWANFLCFRADRPDQKHAGGGRFWQDSAQELF